MQLHKLSILLSFFLVLLPLVKPDLASEKLALVSLRSAVGGRTLLWNVSEQSPCKWFGVQCKNDVVVQLRLPGFALSGSIPTGIFGNLTRLRTLSLRFNALKGVLPQDLASCVNLRSLYLQQNLLSGEIPESLFALHDLFQLNLASNKFSGPIPLGFNNLTRLRTLFLENNNLSGAIPQLNLVKLEQFNVSNNVLNGSVPEKLQTFSRNSFLGNSLCGKPLNLCPGDVNGTGTGTGTGAGIGTGKSPKPEIDNNEGNMKKKKKLSGGAIAGIVVGSAVCLLLILFALIIFCRKSSNQKTRSLDILTEKQLEVAIRGSGDKPVSELEHSSVYSAAAGASAAVTAMEDSAGAKKLVFFGHSPKVFDLEDLLRASAEVLGKGTFGTAYKATLEDGPVVAVKRLRDVTISDSEFKEKIEAVGAMDHENLVPLKAYYYSREEKLLVCDYIPTGSLSALLHGEIILIPSVSFITCLFHGRFTST